MKKIVKYIAFNNEEFESAEECLAYEASELAFMQSPKELGIVALDEEFSPLFKGEQTVIDRESDFDNVSYIILPNEESINWFNSLGIYGGFDMDITPDKPGFYMYDDSSTRRFGQLEWINIEETIEDLQNILIQLKRCIR